MARKIFKETKMQGGNIYRPYKGKENIKILLLSSSEKQKAKKMNINELIVCYTGITSLVLVSVLVIAERWSR